nr:PHD finger protein 11 isoform X2 [Equus asinus]
MEPPEESTTERPAASWLQPTRGAAWAEAQDALPRPTGVFQVTEKMEKRNCALCPKDLECSVMYFARSENIAAHENCLLYSSALVECEDHDSHNADRNFDVKSVKKEIKRGSKLRCKFCGKKGATVGCEVQACLKNYHFFCAKNDNAVLQTDGSQGIYKLFCQVHAPLINTQNADFSGVKRKRGRKRRLPEGIYIQPSEAETFTRLIKQMNEDGRQTDATVKVDFLKKCKEAGLLDDFFEEILDKLHLIQERLMDETTSESDRALLKLQPAPRSPRTACQSTGSWAPARQLCISDSSRGCCFCSLT